MAANESWKQRREQWTKPHVLLCLIGAAGLAMTALALTNGLLPALQAKSDSAEELEMLLRRKETLMKTEPPPPYDPLQAEAWGRKVPDAERADELIMQLTRLERSIGARIVSLEFGGGTPSSTPSGERNSVSAADAPLLQEQRAELQLEGTYTQLYDFLDGLRELERLTSVTRWSLKLLGDTTKDNGASVKMTLHATIKIYTAPGFASLFPEGVTDADQDAGG